MSDSLRPHGLQLDRLLHPPLSPGVCWNSPPLSGWSYLTVSSSAASLSFLLSIFPSIMEYTYTCRIFFHHLGAPTLSVAPFFPKENLSGAEESLYYFSRAAITNHHKLGGLKQHICVISQFQRLEVWSQGVNRGVAFWKFWARMVPCLSRRFWWLPAGPGTPWLTGASPWFPPLSSLGLLSGSFLFLFLREHLSLDLDSYQIILDGLVSRL